MLVSAHIDFETYSDLDLTKVGVYRYAESPYTGIWWLSYRFQHQAVHRWFPGEHWMPHELIDHVAAGGRLVAHNAAFERTIWNVVLRRYPGCTNWPLIRIEQQDCTMARAAVLAVPLDLDRAVNVLGGKYVKDAEGHALMLRMSRPKKIVDGIPQFETDPSKIERLGLYCDRDVEAETGIDDIEPPLSDSERRIWEMDQHINDRGVQLDVDMITRLLGVADEALSRANRRIWELTNGAVTKVTEVAKIVAWLNSRGIQCTSVAAEDTEELMLVSDVVAADDSAKEVIELRRAAAKASTSKLKTALRCVCADGRARGLISYHVATTGRFAGRLIQPHNLVRVDEDRERPTVLRIIEAAKSTDFAREAHDRIDAIVGPLLDKEYVLNGVMPWLAKCLRPMFISKPGHDLLGADLANIEGRVNAEISGETWKVQAFRDYDAGIGPDLYRLSYARSFNATDLAALTQWQRQIGKVQELALGYQGSVGAYLDMGKNYGLKPYKLAVAVREVTSAEVWDKTASQYAKATNKVGLDIFAWTGLKICVDGWRREHPHIVSGWWGLQDAAIEATARPDTIVPVEAYGGRVRYLRSKGFLWCSLPSGRILAYCNPRLREVSTNSTVYYTIDGHALFAHEAIDGEMLFHEDGTLVSDDERRYRIKRVVAFDALGENRQWRTFHLYGGMQCNNVVQAIARDVLCEKMEIAEAMSYPIVLHVHDEMVAEVAERFGSEKEFSWIMSLPLRWLPNLPLAAKAWRDKRYVK